VRNHRIILGVGVFLNVQIFLDSSVWIRKESPHGSDRCPKFLERVVVVSRNRDDLRIRHGDLRIKRRASPYDRAVRSRGKHPRAQYQNAWLVSWRQWELSINKVSFTYRATPSTLSRPAAGIGQIRRRNMSTCVSLTPQAIIHFGRATPTLPNKNTGLTKMSHYRKYEAVCTD